MKADPPQAVKTVRASEAPPGPKLAKACLQVVRCAHWLGHRQVIHNPSNSADVNHSKDLNGSSRQQSIQANHLKKKNPTSRPQQSLSPFDRRSALPMGSGEGLFFSLAWAPTHSKSVHPTEAGSSTTRSKAGQPTPLIFRLEQYSQIKCLHDQQDNTTDGPPLARTMSPHLRPVMSFVSPFFAFQLCFPSMI